MTPNPDPQPQPFCMYCDLAIRKTRDATRNEWEHMDGFSFCKDGQHWAWPRTMNPDPQGGESNMTDEPKPRYDSASGEVTYVVGGIHYNSRAEANHYKPEGATTQPTPAVPKQNWRQFIAQLDGIEDSAHIEAKIRSRVDMNDATPDDWIWETLAFLEGQGFLASPAQPVPSAGSKPQEQGGTPQCAGPFVDAWDCPVHDPRKSVHPPEPLRVQIKPDDWKECKTALRVCENCEQTYEKHHHSRGDAFCYIVGDELFRYVHPSALPDPPALPEAIAPKDTPTEPKSAPVAGSC